MSQTTQTATRSNDGAEAVLSTDVLVVGAGPTGLTLAAALVARHVRVTVVDRLSEGANTSRAAVVHARTLEALEAYPYTLMVSQAVTEAVLPNGLLIEAARDVFRSRANGINCPRGRGPSKRRRTPWAQIAR